MRGPAALALAALLVAGAARAQAPRPAAPVEVVAGAVRWSAARDTLPEWARGLPRPPATRADSLALWTALAARPGLADLGALRLGALALAAGDSARADSCWAAAVAADGVWAWPALRERAALALARGDPARADALLEAARRDGWPDAERAAWLALRVRLRAALGDTAQAIGFARQALRVYPSFGAAGQALSALETLLAARGDTLTAAEQRTAAEVEVYRGDRAAAALRLRRSLPRLARAERAAAGRRLAEVLRVARHFAAAGEAAQAAFAAAADDSGRALATLERARALRDGGQLDEAVRAFALAARTARDVDTRDAADWEGGRVAEQQGRWAGARARFAACARGRGAHAGDAALHDGLTWLADGRADSACAAWVHDTTDAARLWTGVARRALGERATGDSVLRDVAARTGYEFHVALARDTLAVAGEVVAPAPDACADAVCAALAPARALGALGLEDDAGTLLARWVAGDPRVRGGGPPGTAATLAGAEVAYASGRMALGLALAERAAREAGDPLRAATVAWAYPPAFESLFVAPRDTAVAALEPALLFALVRQESRFDPRARSRSDALGLMQLKVTSAADVARWLRDPAPTESTLFDPAMNVRYGARYLRRLLARCDGRVAVALAAYNAGAGTLPPWWREVVARGGEALFCELVANGDYPRRILGYRAAYRGLRPTLAR